jgi:hypothetical protein
VIVEDIGAFCEALARSLAGRESLCQSLVVAAITTYIHTPLLFLTFFLIGEDEFFYLFSKCRGVLLFYFLVIFYFISFYFILFFDGRISLPAPPHFAEEEWGFWAWRSLLLKIAFSFKTVNA